MNQPLRPPPGGRPLTAGRAVVLFAVYVAVFAVGGGLGAGVSAMLFELLTFDLFAGIALSLDDDLYLYAIMFGVTGFIAYRLAQRVAEG